MLNRIYALKHTYSLCRDQQNYETKLLKLNMPKVMLMKIMKAPLLLQIIDKLMVLPIDLP